MTTFAADYQAKADKLCETVDELMSRENWEAVEDKDGVLVERMNSSNYDGYMFKMTFVANMSLSDFMLVTQPKVLGGEREKWDTEIKGITILEEVTENLKIIRHETTKFGAGIVSPREFVLMVYQKTIPETNTTVQVMESVEHSECREKDDIIRASRYPTGMYVTNDGESSSLKVVVLSQVDMGGLIPMSFFKNLLPFMVVSYPEDLPKYLQIIKS
ncbi:stAR-related lipid transfer protein 5-like [Anneissia japonica]|uniref:stAR-related lipid transfer protein 5-like n=1 Tax=Anneissia japonica TaxID=1529436 RepID=UPI0014255AFA|nr:stAR-related lipid transfer protein 5-like [Anneissia japonica]